MRIESNYNKKTSATQVKIITREQKFKNDSFSKITADEVTQMVREKQPQAWLCTKVNNHIINCVIQESGSFSIEYLNRAE